MVFSNEDKILMKKFVFEGVHSKEVDRRLSWEKLDEAWTWAAKQLRLEPSRLPYLGLMQEQVYKTAVRNAADLWQHLTETWSSIPQTVIVEAIDEWGLRLRALAVTNRLFSQPPTFYRRK